MDSGIEATGRRERKRNQTADHLTACAFELFAQHGFDAVTMEQIAARADVAKGTLYNYFPVKEALISHRFHQELAAEMPQLFARLHDVPHCADRLHAFLLTTARYSEGMRDYMGHYIHYRLSQAKVPEGQASRSGLDQVYTALLAEGQQQGEIRTDIPLEQLVLNLQFMHLGVLLHWQRTPDADLLAGFEGMLRLFLSGASA